MADNEMTHPSPLRSFKRQLEHVDPIHRDAWLNQILGMNELPEDRTDLPFGCVPYLPVPVETLLRTIARAKITNDDVFVDVGSGLGRAMMFVHLATGAAAIGLEIQEDLANRARALALSHGLARIITLCGDAEKLIGSVTSGTVFFFYCPFGADRALRVMNAIKPLALVRPLRLCFVDMPIPAVPWIVEDSGAVDEPVTVCTTQLHAGLDHPLASSASTY